MFVPAKKVFWPVICKHTLHFNVAKTCRWKSASCTGNVTKAGIPIMPLCFAVLSFDSRLFREFAPGRQHAHCIIHFAAFPLESLFQKQS